MISFTNLIRIGWTTGSFAVSQGLRLVTNVVLARLLSPELFGIMLIVTTLRTGVDLLSDLGIGQNIVSNKRGEDPLFYNTAWSLQILRGLGLFLISLLLAIPAGHFYGSPLIAAVLPVACLYFVIRSFDSVSRYLLQKKLTLSRPSILETMVAVVSSVTHIAFTIVSPTIWALVYAGLATSLFQMVGSYFLMPGLRHQFVIAKEHAAEIFRFGKWIFLSTTVYFLSLNFDRLYLGKTIEWETLGVYGIARSLSEVFSMLVRRISHLILFPLVASSRHSREELRHKIAKARPRVLLIAAVGLSLFVALSDGIVQILYDSRYHDAAWMLPIMAAGIWFSILAGLAESILLGIGRPMHGAIASTVKLGGLVVGLPFAIGWYGIIGAVCVVALADAVLYVPFMISQKRERLLFGLQDLVLTIFFFLMIAVWRTLLGVVGIVDSIGSITLPSF